MTDSAAVNTFIGADKATSGAMTRLIADVTQDFASSLNIEETLQNAIDRFITYLDAEAASIFLLDERSNTLVCRECVGPVDVMGLTLSPFQGIVGKTVKENAPQIVRDVASDPNFAASVDRDTGFVTRSILCAPLTVRGNCIGALELINKRSGDGLFGDQDKDLVTAVAAAAALAIHNARMAEELVEQERVRKELELARQIQEGLLPRDTKTGLPVTGLNLPAREVSGDFFDYFELPDGRIYFNLADVSGKGMNAALLMAKTCSLLRCLAKTEHDAGELLARVNNEICETSSMGMFVTLVSGYIDPARKTVAFSNAGHQPVLFRSKTGAYTEYPAAAPPVGVLPQQRYPVEELPLDAGGIYLFTDGITEAARSDGSQLETEGVCALIDEFIGSAPADRLANIVERLHTSGMKTHDDVTMLLIES